MELWFFYIWDTAEQERFHSLGAAFYRGADCCVLVYDVNDLKSFETLNTWHSEFLKQASPMESETFPFVLIGNKTDADGGNSRVVADKRAIEWCGSKENIPYYETSAKEDVNVDEAFLGVAHKTLSSDLKQNIYIPVISEYFADIHEEQSRRCSCWFIQLLSDQ